MLKHLVIFGLLILGVLACAQKPLPVEGSQQQNSQPHTNKAQQDAPPPCISEVCKENAENAERYAYYKAHPKEYLKAAIVPANLSNWILAGLGVIGGVLALFTVLTMRWSSERQLRAYVMAELGTIVNIADPDHAPGEFTPTPARITNPGWGPIVQMQIKNTGQTPAHNVVHWANICYREYPLESDLPTTEEVEKFKSTLGPNISITKNLFFGPRLTAEQIGGLKNGASAIWVYGEIRYRDAFKKKHFTRYRLLYHQQFGAIGVSTTLGFAETGNEAD